MNKLPLARSIGIILQNLGKEVLVYDLNTHKALNLNETSATVYKACDGIMTFDELKRNHQFTDEIILLALDELNKENLLDKSDDFNFPFTGMNRREMIRKAGVASMIALPVIASLVAPTAVMAQSSCATPTNRANGCPAGSTVTITGGVTCAGYSDANKSAVCDAFYGSQCLSTNATYAGNCVQAGTDIQYTCVCAT